MIAYLSGGMEHAVNEGEDWRNKITEWLRKNLGHSVIDPVKKSRQIVDETQSHDYRLWKNSDRGKYKAFVRQLIRQDLDGVINKADYVICLWDEGVVKGGGTHGEVTIAYHYNIPVFLVNTLPFDELSGWIFSCCTEVFPDFINLKKRVLELYG
ncbi:MAG TPA: hypothetical protein DIS65_05755 [Candidatus Marinimicrobia bacterium]|nr:hypothetical protein [Candidatus Neomarinimicrobiota bacterium]